jgi:hypothetical protein
MRHPLPYARVKVDACRDTTAPPCCMLRVACCALDAARCMLHSRKLRSDDSGGTAALPSQRSWTEWCKSPAAERTALYHSLAYRLQRASICCTTAFRQRETLPRSAFCNGQRNGITRGRHRTALQHVEMQHATPCERGSARLTLERHAVRDTGAGFLRCANQNGVPWRRLGQRHVSQHVAPRRNSLHLWRSMMRASSHFFRRAVRRAMGGLMAHVIICASPLRPSASVAF